jgi:hypothetical protein
MSDWRRRTADYFKKKREEAMKSPNDPTSQSEDETKFYQKIEADLELENAAKEIIATTEAVPGMNSYSFVLRKLQESVKAKRIAYAIAQVERLRRELEAAKHNLRVEQGYSQ